MAPAEWRERGSSPDRYSTSLTAPGGGAPRGQWIWPTGSGDGSVAYTDDPATFGGWLLEAPGGARILEAEFTGVAHRNERDKQYLRLDLAADTSFGAFIDAYEYSSVVPLEGATVRLTARAGGGARVVRNTLAAQAAWGVETWTRRGEAFSVYFTLFSMVSPFETRERVVGVRPPLSGLPRLDAVPGTVAFVSVMIGTVTFDGLSQGGLWQDVSVRLTDGFTAVGVSLSTAPTLADTIGLVLGVLLVAGFYRVGIDGARSVGGELGAERLRLGFVHTLVPIAAVYVAAHYLTFLIFEGQAIGYLASDPFGQGWDLFGTASSAIDYSLISQNGAWYAQVAFVVLGHVAALVLAHDRALALYGQASLAVRSQYWMLGIMVGFTTLALWLLAQAGA
jgi:hypothetical protein